MITIDWEKVNVIHVSHKGLISKIKKQIDHIINNKNNPNDKDLRLTLILKYLFFSLSSPLELCKRISK